MGASYGLHESHGYHEANLRDKYQETCHNMLNVLDKQFYKPYIYIP
jgi:hypothetical protein